MSAPAVRAVPDDPAPAELARDRHAATVLAYLRVSGEPLTARELMRRLPGVPPEYVVLALADLEGRGLVRLPDDRWRAARLGVHAGGGREAGR